MRPVLGTWIDHLQVAVEVLVPQTVMEEQVLRRIRAEGRLLVSLIVERDEKAVGARAQTLQILPGRMFAKAM